MSTFACFSASPAVTLQNLLSTVSDAASQGAEYVAVPEWHMERPETLNGPTLARFADLAREKRIWIALPVEESAGNGGYFRTTTLLNHRGETVARYREILPGDSAAERGSPFDVLESIPAPRQRIGIVAGGDIQTGVARLAARGAAIVLVTAAWDSDPENHWRQLCRDLSRTYRVNLVVSSRNRAITGIYRAGESDAVAPQSGIVLASIDSPGAAISNSLGLPSVPIPSTYTTDPRLIELGRQLFFDPILSGNRKVSCASCHDPLLAFTNRARHAAGAGGAPTSRNVPSLLNVAYRGVLFWDGRSSTLESQAKFPMTHAHEMNRHYLDAVADVRSQPGYREQFRAAHVEKIEYEDVAAALASYQRSLISGNSPFDRYLYGADSTAIAENALRGLALFRGKANCASCHSIGADFALLMDQQFHNTGVAYDAATKSFRDTGFGAISYQGVPGVFLTPSLRDVARTAPYMHDGSIATLRDVVEFYNRGGRPNPYLDPQIKALQLTAQECSDLVAFLEALSGADAYSADGRRLPAAGRAVAIDFRPRAGDVPGNRRRIAGLVSRAAASGANLVVLPEHSEAGRAAGPYGKSPIVGSLAFFGGLAKSNRVYLVATAPEVLPSGRTYLRSLCFDPLGRLAGAFRKSVPDERDVGIAAGDFRTLEPIDTGLGPIGILSAADLVRGVPRLASRGARLVAVSTSWSPAEMSDWAEVIRELETETGVKLILAATAEDQVRSVDWTLEPPAPGPALGLPPVPQPAGHPATEAAVELGRTLFFDRSLSLDGRVNCATCHDPSKAFATSEPSTPGVFGRANKLHPPTLLNNGFRLFQTWDGRVENAEEQIRKALLGFAEMDMTEKEVVARVSANPEYQRYLHEGSGRSEFRFEDVTSSLAAFVRTLVSGNSPFDRYYYGHDIAALNEPARQGLALFQNKARCALCHTISRDHTLFSDSRFHNTGVGYQRFFSYLGYSGNGVEGNLVTRNKARGEYLTPSLRNVARTAPYMHDGSLATLHDVVQFYNRGGRANPFLDSRIRPLHLTPAEQENLVAFLNTLTGEDPAVVSANKTQGVEKHASLSH